MMIYLSLIKPVGIFSHTVHYKVLENYIIVNIEA